MRRTQALEDPFCLPCTHGSQEDSLSALGDTVGRRIENSNGNIVSSTPQALYQRIELVLVLGRGHSDDILEHDVVRAGRRYNLQ
jgi:hypothetical protein